MSELEVLTANQPKKGSKFLVEWAHKKFTEAKNERLVYQRQWELNLQFYFGEQYVRPKSSFSATTDGPQAIPNVAPYWVARPVVNRIRPTIRSELSRLVSQKPTAQIVPASSEDADQYAALAGEQIWNTIYREKKIRRIIRKAAFWQTTTGTGFIKDYWDPGAVDLANNLRGDMVFTAISPFHVYVPDLREEEVEGQPYIFHAQVKSLDYCRQYYKINNNERGNTTEEDTIMGSATGKLLGASTNNSDKKVLVVECWVKPGAVSFLPKGAMFVIIGDTIVQSYEGWPYAHGEYPFSKLDHLPTGRFYGESVIKDLIPLQKELNRTHGQIIEAKNRMAKPQLIAPRGSVDASRITTEPGLLIEYKPGFNPPEPLPLQPLPSYVENTIDRLKSDWEDIAGIHEVTKGTVPGSLTAATAISYLQEKDESMLSFSISSVEDAVEKIARHSLNHVKQFWDTTRTVKVVGSNGTYDYLAFKGAELRGNTDIQIDAGSALPQSKAAKQASVMEFYQQGAITREEMFEVLDMGGLGKIYERIQVDQKQIQRENNDMMSVTEDDIQMHNAEELDEVLQSGFAQLEDNGMPMDIRSGKILPPRLIVEVNTYDNHELHIQEHNNYRKGQAFRSAPPHVKRLFENHVQQHLDSLIAESAGMTMYGSTPTGAVPGEEAYAGETPYTGAEATPQAEGSSTTPSQETPSEPTSSTNEQPLTQG